MKNIKIGYGRLKTESNILKNEIEILKRKIIVLEEEKKLWQNKALG